MTEEKFLDRISKTAEKKKNSGWGGKREGAGRKSGEPKTIVRVPNRLLDAVLALIKG